jgi:hypothetical protein
MMRLVAACALLVALLLPAAGRADDIHVSQAALAATDDAYVLSADFEFDLSARLEDALSKGVPLYFLVEFEATRSRWYWFDEKVASATQTWRVSFHALTRTYRLSSGALTQSFNSLAEALRTMSRVRGWTVMERDRLRPDTTYLIAVRMRLDTTQLPKPFQVSAIANRDWTLASSWYRWQYTPPPAEPAK